MSLMPMTPLKMQWGYKAQLLYILSPNVKGGEVMIANPFRLPWYERVTWGKANGWKLLLGWGIYGGIWLSCFGYNDAMGLSWAFSFIAGWIIWCARFMD